MDAERLARALEELGEPGYRCAQVLRAVFQGCAGSYDEITVLPAALRRALAEKAPVSSVREEEALSSGDGRAHKAVLGLADGERIETVLLQTKPGEEWTACISCQAGCAVGCDFCATGRGGLSRSLAAEEISDQVLFWRRRLKAGDPPGALTNVVYMGMGEPFHNYEAVARSLRTLIEPGALGMAARRVSVSTAGVVPGMERLAAEFPQVNLALSLHAADDALRDRLVPLNKAYALKSLAQALSRIIGAARRKVFLEYALLAGENDSPEHADKLAAFVREVGHPGLAHVNIIALNPTDSRHRPSPPETVRAFRDRLRSLGVPVSVRKSLGADIQGACGQLASRKKG
jgi:23S rRNA (adenine2503-C2)-methyltransferase